MLHITNGESVIRTFREMEMEGEYLSWLDVLVEGPVPQCESLEALSAVRARFVADCGWATHDEAVEQFAERDRVVQSSPEQDEVVLWFECDLYDQLQLLQVLDWYHTNPPPPGKLTLLHPQAHLGTVPAELLKALLPYRQEVRPEQLLLAHRAWKAFTAPEPLGLMELLTLEDTAMDALPYLRVNTLRFLAEYPSMRNGLSLSERLFLEAVAAGQRERGAIFQAYSEKDKPVFLSDWSAWRRLDRLVEGGAITGGESHEITSFGRELLAGNADFIRGRGVDAWLGGVHLKGSDAAWRWDAATQSLVARRSEQALAGTLPHGRGSATDSEPRA